MLPVPVPEPPPSGSVPTCSEAGVLGAVTGVMGTLQATEVLKEILGIGETLSGVSWYGTRWQVASARSNCAQIHRVRCAVQRQQ